MRSGQNKHGFTIVELLIVIVVIAILAAITIVAFNGLQARGRDADRKQDLAHLSRALKMYAVDNGDDYASLLCGSGGANSYGWLGSDYDAAGPLKSINACLIDGGQLTNALVDPGGLGSCSGASCFAYMKASCASGTYLYAHLETLPQTAADLDGTCQATWDTTYGMNHVVRVN